MDNVTSLVSIVIPAYNHAGYLDEAIQSVLAQTYPNVELIVLNDGSTDETAEVLRRWGDRFRWETHANMGQSATLNKGWGIAHGEILGYLSADDALTPEAVSTAIAEFLAYPDAIATYCDFNLIDPRSRIIRRVSAGDFSLSEMVATVTCPPGPGSFFKRSCYEKIDPWDISLKQMPDYDFWLRLGMQGEVMHIRKVLANFRVHPTSQTFAPMSATRADEPMRIISRFFENTSLAESLVALKPTAMANACLVSAQLHIRAARLRQAASRIKTAWLYDPKCLLSSRAARLILNALLNRASHTLLWIVRGIVGGALGKNN